MNKQIYPLLIAQFLSAFADNAILFTVIAMVMHSASSGYIPALQSVFLVAFVVLAPWVGGFADNHPKSKVLIIANLIKAAGTGLLLFNVEPLIAYCLVGVGAAIYSPAKYGILPELAGAEFLVKANSWIEGSTILAILLGMLVGGKVADFSIVLALVGSIVFFIASALITIALPYQPLVHQPIKGFKVVIFWKQMSAFFTTPRSRFVMLGGSLFWSSATTLRTIIVVWAPLILFSKNATEIAELTLFLAVGIIVGAAIVPRIIPLDHLRRARIPAYLMGVFIVLLSITDAIWPARLMLMFIGVMGGMFIIPVNSALQEHGQDSIGSGSAVALQGFFQNLTELTVVGLYTFAASQGVSPVTSMMILGWFVIVATFFVSIHLPDKK